MRLEEDKRSWIRLSRGLGHAAEAAPPPLAAFLCAGSAAAASLLAAFLYTGSTSAAGLPLPGGAGADSFQTGMLDRDGQEDADLADPGKDVLPCWITAPLRMQGGEPGEDLNQGAQYAFSTDRFLWNVEPKMQRSFSWIDLGKKPTVKSQGNLGTCWAITATSAIEADLLPGQEMVFSADHLSLNNGFQITQDEGGDYYMIMSYLADWKGPVLEAQDPYGDGRTVDGLSAAVHVQETRLLRDMSQARIKQTIFRFGPVQSSLCMDRDHTDNEQLGCYNAENCAYFDPIVETLNHDILILGWDDSYSREHFQTRPREDGAWICQNTWGTDFGQDGIFYVSYEDANLLRKGGIVYTDVEGPDSLDHVYENDSLGWQARQGYGMSSAYFAGVFQLPKEEEPAEVQESGAARESGPAAVQESAPAQELSAVGFYATGPATAYRICLIPEFSGEEDLAAAGPPAADEAAADGNSSTEILAQGWLEMPGYYTIRIPDPVRLRPGQRFAVAVFVDTMNAEKPVAVEMARDAYTQNVVLDGRETYISPDGEHWERTQTSYGTNVCLKVYTKDEGTLSVSFREEIA